jgi:hypothetical protein
MQVPAHFYFPHIFAQKQYQNEAPGEDRSWAMALKAVAG